MKMIQVFDKPMCCSTGVCGPQVDPVLAHFAADLEWIRSQGVSAERFNLGQQPTAFIENTAIHKLLSTQGTDSLPVILVDGQVVSQSLYPSRETLAEWVGLRPAPKPLLVISGDGDCCQGTDCCQVS
jgi:arsenite methyltransferase